MKNHEAILKEYNLEILSYLEKERPPTKHVLYFVGTLLHSLLDNLKMTTKERDAYLEIYNTIIKNKIFSSQIIEETERVDQVEFATL